MNAHDDLILLDTCVLLHLFRGSELGSKIDEDLGLRSRPERPLISVVTAGEILAIAVRKDYGKEKLAKLAELIRDLVVVDIRFPISQRYADIQARQQKIGRPIGENDTWIAATALATGATLITTDRHDFGKLEPAPIKIILYDTKLRS